MLVRFSIKLILFVMCIYYHTLVSPGIGAAIYIFKIPLQTAFAFKLLITLLLPTLGYPTNPILIFFFSL